MADEPDERTETPEPAAQPDEAPAETPPDGTDAEPVEPSSAAPAKEPKAAAEPETAPKNEPKKQPPKKRGKKGKGNQESRASKEPSEPDPTADPDFQHLVRISNTDLDGKKPFRTALTSVRGIGHRLSLVVARQAKIEPTRKIGTLSDDQIVMVQGIVEGIAEAAPAWAVNRRLDPDSGANLHVVGAEVQLFLRDDLNRLKKIRSYRGIRHERGLPVRGQRTRSNGRRGLAVGVVRTKAIADKKKASAEEKK